MLTKNTLIVASGFGAWALFLIVIASSGFGLLENLVGTHVSNWLLLLSILLAILASGLLIKKLGELNALTLPVAGGILGLVLLATLLVLALMRATRYA